MRKQTPLTLGLVAVLFLHFACQTAEQPELLTSKAQPIIGGQPDLNYPGIGALNINRQSNFCTGTLITPRLVVTAAHCVDALNNYIQQGLETFFRMDFPTGSGNNFRSEYVPIQSAQNHPLWNPSGLRNDIAVVILRDPVRTTKPLPINTSSIDASWIGRELYFLGYGVIQTRPARVRATRKYSARIPIIRVASQTYSNESPNRSICSGDSGGPALFVDGVAVVMGVNSYVQGSQVAPRTPACDGSSTSFRIDAYLDWLLPLMRQYGGSCQSNADCTNGQICTNGSCQNPPPGGVGAACDAVRRCAQGLSCTNRICRQVCSVNKGTPIVGAPGAACNNFQCANGGTCIRTNTGPFCLPVPCDPNGGCTNGGTCYSVSDLGQFCFCRANAECSSGFCNTENLTRVFGQIQPLGACTTAPPTQRTSCPQGSSCQDTQQNNACSENSASCVCR
ncbi:MAG: trypsin-like serine protease [Myxococcota bacterium]